MPFPKIIISFLIALFLIALYAQKSSKKYFTNLSTVDNLSQNSVSHILQDSQGMIWLATNAGLDKHIGNEILHVEGFPKSLVQDITLLHDPSGDYIFICTNTANYRMHKWYNQNKTIRPEELGNELTNILYLHKIDEKKYLVFTDTCIALADDVLKNVHQKTSKDAIQAIATYDGNTFFLGTDKGLFQYNLSKNKLAPTTEIENTTALFIPKEGNTPYLYAAIQKTQPAWVSEIIRYSIRPNGQLADKTNLGSLSSPISSLYVGEDDRLWVGTQSEGLYIFNIKESSLPGNPEIHYCVQSNMNEIRRPFSSNEINTLHASKDGVIWVGTEGGGVNLFHQKKQAFKSSYTQEAFTTFYKNKAPARTETYNNNVWSICSYPPGSGNTVLIGTEGNGVVYFDLAGDRILKNILPSDTEPDAAKTVQKIRPGFNQDFILGTNAGLYRLTLNSSNLLPDHYTPISTIGNKDFSQETSEISLLEYSPKHGNWLAGDKGGEGIHIFDKNVEKHLKSIIIPNKDKEGLSFMQPLDTFTLVGTTHGLYKINSSGDSLLPFSDGTTKVKDMHYICAYQDKKSGKIWLGTDKMGLHYYTDQGGIKKVPGFDRPEVIYDIHLDNQNHLWFSTNHGIYEYIEESGIFNQYGISDGIQVHEYNGGATAIIGSDSNTIAFGGINGICYFKPDSTTTLLYSTAFKPVIRWRYPSDQDTLRDKSYHTEYINYNDTSKVEINVNYKFAYLDLTPMLGDYQNSGNNQFLVTLNGKPLPDTKGSYIIPENSFRSTLHFWKPQNLISVRYRSGNSNWLPNDKEQVLQLVVHRQFFTGDNWLWVALIIFIGIAVLLLIRYINSWNKVRIVQEKISEISRLDKTDEICKVAIQHLMKNLKFHYAVISLVDFDKKMINSRYGASNKRQIPDPSLWMSKSSYPLNHSDILARTIEIQESIMVAGERVISIGDKKSSQYAAIDGKSLFNLDIMKAHGHDKLVRIFIPIIYRSSSSGHSGNNSKDDDVALGVVEVGYFYDQVSQVLRWLQAFSSFSFQSNVLRYLRYLEREKIRLQFYVNNLAYPYFRTYIKDQKKQIYKFVEDIEKGSNQNRLDHTGFLQLVLNKMAIRLGVKYGDISLVSYNTDEIDFMHETLTYGYTHEDVKENNKRFRKENEGKEGIINYLAKNYNEKNGEAENRLLYYYTGDVVNDKRYIKFLEDARSEMVLPMVLNDDATLIGVVNFISTEPDYFNRVLATIYAKGVKKATDIYLQKKQYNALKAIVLPFDTFTQTEESIYRSMVESLKQYFLCDYISVWTRASFDSSEFELSKATLSNFYEHYKAFDFTKAKIKEDDSAGNPAEITHVNTIENKESRLYRFATQPDIQFKAYIILRISIDDKYQAFINVFSKRTINDDEISGYSEAFLDEITKKVGFAIQTSRLLNSVKSVTSSLANREQSSPEQMIVNQAYSLLPSVDSVVLFPYKQGKTILIKEAIVGGANLPEEDLANKEKPAYFANLILEKGTQWIENESQYLDLAYKAFSERLHEGTFWRKKSLKSVAAIRLVHDEEALGVMFFNYTAAKKFKEDNSMIFIDAFTNFAKVALLNEDFIKRLQEERMKVEQENNNLARTQRELKAEKEQLQQGKKDIEEILEKIHKKAAGESFFLILQGINHDIRNLLLGMAASLDWYSEKVPDRDKSEFEVLQQGVKLNTEKIAALLQLFRPAAVQKIESISINETIGKVLRFFEGQKTAVNFKKIFSDTPLNLACNKTEFSMIIYNLLKNAIQSIREKGISAGEIVISTKIENKHFVIEIEDNGIGIDKAKTETIFDLGYTTKPDGTGVGLYFVKKTIENHYDGRIRVSSQKGKGAVFIIEIPVAINYVLRADDLWS